MSRPDPEISVILPAAGPAPWLQEAVESMLGQTEPRFELLLIDDGLTPPATDRFALNSAEGPGSDPRLRLLATPFEARGLVQALTLGLAHARGGFIARMDADDVAHPQRLALQAQRLRDAPDLGLVSCRVRYEGQEVAGDGYAEHVDWCNRLLTREQMDLNRFVESPCPHPSVMFRADLPGRFGGYREGPFPEDYELWLRWLEAGVAMEKMDRELLVWRDSAARLSRTDSRYSTAAFYEIKAEYLARWLQARNPFHPHITVWGAGRITRQRLRPLTARGVQIDAFVDIDPKKIGRTVAGVPVLAPADLPAPGRCFMLSYVAARGARDLIAAFLHERGYQLGRDYLLAA